MNQSTTTRRSSDEAAVREVYQRFMEAWNRGSGAGLAEVFTEDGDLVGFDGTHLQGPQEIGPFHQQLFDKWLKGSRLLVQVTGVRFLSPDVALMHAVGRTVMRGEQAPTPERDSIQTLVVTRQEGGDWRLAAFQNTRLRLISGGGGRAFLAWTLSDWLWKAFRPSTRRSLDMDEASVTRHRRDHELAAPLGQATSGRLVFKPGAARLTVRGDPAMTDLYRASFDTPAPTVRVQGGTVTVHYPRMARLRDLRALLGPRPGGEVALNGSIPWYVRVQGGTAHTTFDLSRVALYAIELDGGVSEVAMVLPAPSGTVPVRVAGGVHELTVLRPAGVAVRVRVGHGARDLTLDDQHFGAVGGSTRWQSPDYDQASDRYDVAVSGGADTLTIRTG
jgi:uncharacterized protein (TIGR02246 family)